jgi:hypothetical protein
MSACFVTMESMTVRSHVDRLNPMRLHRAFKRWVSGGLVMLVLFMQLATAAYACPAELQALRADAAMAAMPGCEGGMSLDMDADQPQLCKAHCQQGDQVTGAAPACDWTPWPVLLAVIDWRQTAQLSLPSARQWSGPPPGAVPPGSPPIYLSLLVLRN